MLYFDSTDVSLSDITFYINTKGNAGDIIDFTFVREGESTSVYSDSVAVEDGGYYQSVTFEAGELRQDLVDGATYDVFGYSGGLLVYKDKLYYNSTRELGESTIEQYTENSTTNDYLIFD
jgi:hypothetical protein